MLRHGSEMRYCSLQSFQKPDFRLPTEHFLCPGNIGQAVFRIIGSCGQILDLARAFWDYFQYEIREFLHAERLDCSHIHRTHESFFVLHHGNESVDKIINIQKCSRLFSSAIDRNIAVLKRLNDEIANHPSVIPPNSWSVRIEYSNDTGIDSMHSVIVGKDRFCRPFSFGIARPLPYRVHVTKIRFALGLHFGISVYFGRRREQNSCLRFHCEIQYVLRSEDVRHHRGNRIHSIYCRRCRTGQVINLIQFIRLERLVDVMLYERKSRTNQKVGNILLHSSAQIIQASDFVSFIQKSTAKMRSQKTGSTGY